MNEQFDMSSTPIPVNVLTGFLGSGKTTLLRHALSLPALADTAVIINEFGEVGLDHLLVRELAEDVVLLASGCVCCALKDDLSATLRDLLRAASVGEIPPFSRVVLETTGLADPLPIMRLLQVDRQLARWYRLGQVITSVDGVNGLQSLVRYAEATQQVAAADCIIVTKTDLPTSQDLDLLSKRLAAVNPTALLLEAARDRAAIGERLIATAAMERDWASLELLPDGDHLASSPTGVSSFTIEIDRSVDLDDFVDWLDLLLSSRGDSILRVKGYITAIGHDRPLAIQGVQHVLDRPEPMPDWPGEPNRTQLVFITKLVTKRAIENALPSVSRGRD